MPGGHEPLRFQLPVERPNGWIKVTLAPPLGAPNYTLSVLDQALRPEFPPEAFDPHPWIRSVEPGIHAVELKRGDDRLRWVDNVEVYQVQEYLFKDDDP